MSVSVRRRGRDKERECEQRALYRAHSAEATWRARTTSVSLWRSRRVPRPDLTRGVRVCLSLWRGPAAPGPGERRAMGPLDMDGGDFGLGDLDSGVAALLSGLHCHAAMR